MKNAFRLIPIIAALSLAACSSDQLMLQRKVDYRSGSDNLTKNPLEVPPDLTSPAASTNFSVPGKSIAAYQNASAPASTVLPVTSKARIVQDGNQRWLEIQGSADKVWPQLREFWLDNGFLLTIDNPTIGIMETDWLENRANLPQDLVTKLLRKVADSFISTGELDKFRTRIERGSGADVTDIYITHRGMTEVFSDGSTDAKGNSAAGTTNTKTIWTPRPSDPELEAQMLSLMLQRFGMTPEEAQATVQKPVTLQARAALIDNNRTLAVYDNFDRAWRRVGLALDMSGYIVTDRDRSKGVYYVRHADSDIGKEDNSGSFLSKLKFWGGDEKAKAADKVQQGEFEIHVEEAVNQTKVTVLGKDGKPVDAAKQQPLLNALLTQLK
ncbi:outer membrane protein assembly factor BamC [Andreprevotia chitinilytica]|uniref:outer membrane protein assembly factor BamC n=1 Tax=Andreprevotia chitinilytica TaxID=396808 RepID=UPI00146FFAE9|nr:outer membrane protein assembly factor BamC [Andreprevotia chitinilytica]